MDLVQSRISGMDVHNFVMAISIGVPEKDGVMLLAQETLMQPDLCREMRGLSRQKQARSAAHVSRARPEI